MADTVTELVLGLTNPALKEQALLKLSKEREGFPNLAPYLWHSFGTMSSLLQEIVSIYPMLQPPSLTAHASNRVCNALALLQCVASHPDTRTLFLKAHIPLFLYPFLNTVSKTRPFEYLRLTSLGVVGALVKVDDPEVISFLLSTEIIPLCLRTMESGSELSKTVATFIVQKILLVRLFRPNRALISRGRSWSMVVDPASLRPQWLTHLHCPSPGQRWSGLHLRHGGAVLRRVGGVVVGGSRASGSKQRAITEAHRAVLPAAE